MAETKITGKRYSKIETTTINLCDSDAVKEYATKHGEVRPDGTLIFAGNLEKQILDYEKYAVEVLKRANLPYSTNVCHDKDGNVFDYTPQKNGVNYSCLSHYVINKMGFDKDSPEGISSEILTTIHRLKANQSKQKTALRLAFKLGRLCTLLKVYTIESYANKINASHSKKKGWAIELSKHLRRKYPNENFPEAWKKIPRQPPYLQLSEFEIYREEQNGKSFLFECGTDKKLAKETFRTKYFNKF